MHLGIEQEWILIHYWSISRIKRINSRCYSNTYRRFSIIVFAGRCILISRINKILVVAKQLRIIKVIEKCQANDVSKNTQWIWWEHSSSNVFELSCHIK